MHQHICGGTSAVLVGTKNRTTLVWIQRDIIEKRMSPSQIEKAQEMARNWKPKK